MPVQCCSRTDQLFSGRIEPVLWILLVATLFVLLLGCANIANLLLARSQPPARVCCPHGARGRSWSHRPTSRDRGTPAWRVSAVIASVVSLAGVRGLVALSHGSMMRDTQLAVDDARFGSPH